MTATAARAPHRSARRSRTPRRAGRRSVAVLGFAALTWAALTGAAMAAEGGDANPQPQPADAVTSTLDGLTGSNASGQGLAAPVQAVSHALPRTAGTVAGTATRALGGAAVAAHQAPPVSTGSTADASGPVGRVLTDTVGHAIAHVQTDAKAVTDNAGGTASKVTHLATYAVQQPTAQLTQQSGHLKHPVAEGSAPGQASPSTDAASASTSSGDGSSKSDSVATLSIPAIVGGVEDAANDLTRNVLHATQLDQAIPAPQVKVLSSTLDDLGVSKALPSIDVPQLSLPLPTAPLTSAPVVGDSVSDVLSSLPVQTGGSLPLPGTLPLGGGPVTGPTGPTGLPGATTPTGPTGVTVPIPVSPIAPSTYTPAGAPTALGAIPALPVLLPFETFPQIATQGSPAGLTSLTGGDANDPSVYLSKALLNTESGNVDGSGAIPVPTSPHAPAGHDAGPGAGQQDRAELTSLALPGGRLTSPVREYSWHVPAAPTSDPGFSPD